MNPNQNDNVSRVACCTGEAQQSQSDPQWTITEFLQILGSECEMVVRLLELVGQDGPRLAALHSRWQSLGSPNLKRPFSSMSFIKVIYSNPDAAVQFLGACLDAFEHEVEMLTPPNVV